jgi:hypothetical protein
MSTSRTLHNISQLQEYICILAAELQHMNIFLMLVHFVAQTQRKEYLRCKNGVIVETIPNVVRHQKEAAIVV